MFKALRSGALDVVAAAHRYVRLLKPYKYINTQALNDSVISAGPLWLSQTELDGDG